MRRVGNIGDGHAAKNSSNNAPNAFKALADLRKMRDESAQRVEKLHNELGAVIKENLQLEEQLFQRNKRKQHLAMEIREMELKCNKISEKDDKMRGTLIGLNDELEADVATLNALEEEYEECISEYSKKALEASKAIEEMHSRYDENRCKEEIPVLASEIETKKKRLQELTVEMETLDQKMEQLSAKEERMSFMKNHYPSEEMQQFILQLGRQARKQAAAKAMQVSMELRRVELEPMDEEEAPELNPPQVASTPAIGGCGGVAAAASALASRDASPMNRSRYALYSRSGNTTFSRSVLQETEPARPAVGVGGGAASAVSSASVSRSTSPLNRSRSASYSRGGNTTISRNELQETTEPARPGVATTPAVGFGGGGGSGASRDTSASGSFFNTSMATVIPPKRSRYPSYSRGGGGGNVRMFE